MTTFYIPLEKHNFIHFPKLKKYRLGQKVSQCETLLWLAQHNTEPPEPCTTEKTGHCAKNHPLLPSQKSVPQAVSAAHLGFLCPKAKTEMSGGLGTPFHGVSSPFNLSKQGTCSRQACLPPCCPFLDSHVSSSPLPQAC